MNSNMVIDGVDIESLNDEELFTRLHALGATCGPIVESTRKIYQKKLMVLMGGDMVDAAKKNGDVDLDGEEYSDNEEPIEPRKTRSRSRGVDVVGPTSSSKNTTTTTYTSQYTSSSSPDVRRRIAETTALVASPELTAVTFDPERHTPSPRRSLRTVTSSSSETITVRNVINNGSRNQSSYSSLRPLLGEQSQSNVRKRSSLLSDQTNLHESEAHARIVSGPTEIKEEVINEGSSKLATMCRLLVKLVLLALLIIVILYICQLCQKNSPENPMKALEELAKQALEAATGQGVETGDGPVPPAAAPPAAAPPAAAPPAAAPPAVAPPAAPPAPAVPVQ